MARAGHCSSCGETVWLASDGSCMKGHPPECISGAYDVGGEAAEPAKIIYPEQIVYEGSPVEPAIAPPPVEPVYAPQVVPIAEPVGYVPLAQPGPERRPVVTPIAEKPRRSNTLVIVIVIVIVALMCGCVSAAAFLVIPAMKSVSTGVGGAASSAADDARAQACIASRRALGGAVEMWEVSTQGNSASSIDSLSDAKAAVGALVADFDELATCPAGGTISVTDGAFSCSISTHSAP